MPVNVGTPDAPQDFPPTFHVHVGEKIPWFSIGDKLPRYRASGANAEPMPPSADGN